MILIAGMLDTIHFQNIKIFFINNDPLPELGKRIDTKGLRGGKRGGWGNVVHNNKKINSIFFDKTFVPVLQPCAKP